MTKTKNPSAPTPPAERFTAHVHLPVRVLIPAPWHNRIDLVNHEVIGRRRGWTGKGGHLLDHAEKLDRKQLFALLLECFLIDDSYADTYEETTVLALAKAAGVKLDRKTIENRIRAELEKAKDESAKHAKDAKAEPKAAKPVKAKATKTPKPAKTAKASKAKK